VSFCLRVVGCGFLVVRILYLADIRFPLERANGIQSMETCYALAGRGHDVTLVVRPDTHTPPRDPFAFYSDILQAGLLRPSGLQDSITRMAPILLVAAGMIVAFRAGMWNLGSDGQYLLAAACVAGTAPSVLAAVPAPLGWLVLGLVGMAVGASWTIVPAWLGDDLEM